MTHPFTVHVADRQIEVRHPGGNALLSMMRAYDLHDEIYDTLIDFPNVEEFVFRHEDGRALRLDADQAHDLADTLDAAIMQIIDTFEVL